MKLPSLLLGTTLCFFLFLQLVSSQTCSQRVLSFFDEPCTTNDDCYGPDNARLYQCASGVGSSVCEMVYGSAIVNTFGKSCYNNTDCSASPFMACAQSKCNFRKRDGEGCIDGLQCIASSCSVETGLCSGIREGQPCSNLTSLSDMVTSRCQNFAFCDPVGTMDAPGVPACAAKKQPGEACSLINSCRFGTCTNNVCPPMAKLLNQACNSTSECDLGLFCKTVTINGTDSSTCVNLGKFNETCSDNSECDDDHTCFGGICTLSTSIPCDDSNAQICKGGCFCKNAAEGFCGGGRNSCQTYKALLNRCEQTNCVSFGTRNFDGSSLFYPFDITGCLQLQCGQHLKALMKCQEYVHQAAGKPIPQILHYNYFPYSPPPLSSAMPDVPRGSSSTNHVSLIALGFIAVATLLF